MNSRTKLALKTPIIGRVVIMNKYMITHSLRAYKIVKHNYIDSLLSQGNLLFKYAYRQLQGMDYYKRIIELVYEIQAQAYFIASLGGWEAKVAATIDSDCESIIYQISRQRNQNH